MADHSRRPPDRQLAGVLAAGTVFNVHNGLRPAGAVTIMGGTGCKWHQIATREKN